MQQQQAFPIPALINELSLIACSGSIWPSSSCLSTYSLGRKRKGPKGARHREGQEGSRPEHHSHQGGPRIQVASRWIKKKKKNSCSFVIAFLSNKTTFKRVARRSLIHPALLVSSKHGPRYKRVKTVFTKVSRGPPYLGTSTWYWALYCFKASTMALSWHWDDTSMKSLRTLTNTRAWKASGWMLGLHSNSREMPCSTVLNSMLASRASRLCLSTLKEASSCQSNHEQTERAKHLVVVLHHALLNSHSPRW